LRSGTIEQALEINRWIHASLGAICIVSGLLALTAKKTPGRHPKAGRIFVVSLGFSFFAILVNIVVQKNVFMLGIGWLAVYAAADGWRALLRFRGSLSPAPTAFDYVLGGTTTLLSVGLLAFGGQVFVSSSNPMGLVCVGFALLGGGLVRGTWKRWKAPLSKQQWLAVHIGMMMGAFSAAVTAFLAIQLSGHLGGFEWVVWVAPTVLMSRYGAYETKRRGLIEPS
jgi:hypothetical protein